MTPKYDILRGRHKKRASRETQDWNREHLVPECPPWLDRDTWLELMRLRAEAEKVERP